MFRTLWTLFAVWGIGESAPQPPQPWRPVAAVPEAAAVKGIGRNGEEHYEIWISVPSPKCTKIITQPLY